MQHFFTEPGNIRGKEILITGDDVNHIKNVLRMKIGEKISVSNGLDGREYRCEIVSLEDDCITCKLMFIKEDSVELPVRIVLYQGLPKADKMEMIIQKCVELGVYSIVPVATKRAVVKLDDKKEKSKLARWQGISEAAAKQSKRASIPEIKPVMSFKEAVSSIKDFASAAIPYELCEGMKDTKDWVEKVKTVSSGADEDRPLVAVFIGPEGGFDESEIELAKDNGIIPISLGKRILRTETAGMSVLSILMYELEAAEIN